VQVALRIAGRDCIRNQQGRIRRGHYPGLVLLFLAFGVNGWLQYVQGKGSIST